MSYSQHSDVTYFSFKYNFFSCSGDQQQYEAQIVNNSGFNLGMVVLQGISGYQLLHYFNVYMKNYDMCQYVLKF